MLFRTLAELDVDPGRFWVEVFGGDLDPVQLAKRPTGPPRDPVIRRAVARWEGPPPSDATEMSEEHWRRLDELRGEDPALAVRRVKAALKTTEKPWIPRLLAVYGTACRVNSTKAEMAISCGDYERAERCFAVEIEMYRTLSPIDAALTSVDLVRIQILEGRMRSALQTIKDMAALPGPLADNAIASETVRQLIRLALTGERITHRILDQMSQAIKQSRTRPRIASVTEASH